MSGILGSAVSYHIIKQTSPTSGVPANPEFLAVRRVDADIVKNLNFDKSAEARTDRQSGQNEIISSEITGNVSSELAVADPAFHLMLESVMQNEFSADLGISASTIGVDNGTAAWTDSANSFANLEVGHFFGASGFTDSSNDIIYQVLTKTDDNNITTSPAPPITEAAGATIELRGKNVRNGNNQVAYTEQKRIPYTGGVEYQTFEGVQKSTMTVNLTTGSLLSVDHTSVALIQTPGTSEVTGQTDAVKDTSRILGPVAGVPQIWVDGVPTAPSAINVKEANVTIDQGATGEQVVGVEGAASINFADQVTVSGSFNTLTNQSSDTEKAKYDNRTTFGLAFEYRNVKGDTLIIERPQCLYTAFTQTPSAGSLLTNAGTIDAENHATRNYTIQATYIPAV